MTYNAGMAAPLNRFKPGSDLILAALAVLVIITLLLLAPRELLDKADRAAYAVCHRIPSHSFTIAGRQLPLCARCTGTYLAALVGVAVLVLRGKGRAGRFPAPSYLLVLGLFMLAWAADGLNSFLALLSLPHLYEPSNWLRLVTGTLEGITIAAILLPALSVSLWRAPHDVHSIANKRDLLWLLLGAAAIMAAVAGGAEIMLYLLGLLSGLAVPLLLGALNAMLYLALRRRPGVATRWQEVASPLLVGLALAMSEIVLIGIARDALVAALGLPF